MPVPVPDGDRHITRCNWQGNGYPEGCQSPEPVPWELSLDFIGDRRMRRLNRQYRGRDYPTDVLAFPMWTPTRASRVTSELLGDVVISLHTAARQAAARGHSVEEELAMLLVHGILHLCGYDHERGEREARRMRRKEREILRSLGTLPKLVLCV